jgi:hypothetical protein
MKVYKILFFIAIISLLGSLSYWGWIIFTDDKISPQTSTTTASLVISETEVDYDIEFVERKEETEYYHISLKYPQLAGDSVSLGIINRFIQSHVDTAVSSFKRQINENRESLTPASSGFKSGLFINVDDQIIRGEVNNIQTISVSLSLSEYFAGAAHPYNSVIAFTFNAVNGARLQLKDVFTRGDYLNYLSRESRAKLENYKQDGQSIVFDSNMVREGTEPIESNFSNFLIEEETLMIIFNPYQVAPYAAGVIKIKIPLSN